MPNQGLWTRLLNRFYRDRPSINKPMDGYDETRYLRLNPDVAAAVRAGSFSSGWHHYALYGFRENRPGVRPEPDNLVDEAGRPLPPEPLRFRVSGDSSPATFTRVGKIIAANILEALQGKLKLDSQSWIFDFGCGCGRVVQDLHAHFPASHFVGSDIDAEAIQWCCDHLSGIGEFVTNGSWPPLPFKDARFDLICCVSVFTHLPEDMQFAWLTELQRVSRPGGYLVISVHGPDLFRGDEPANSQFRQRGFYYGLGPASADLPDFYQTAYHTHQYIQEQWDRHFEVQQIIRKGINGHQDLVVCRSRGPSS